MRLSGNILSAAALAVLLVPAFNLFASEAAKPATSAVAASNAADPSAPVVRRSGGAAASGSIACGIHANCHALFERARHLHAQVEWFMGYSYLRAMPELAAGNRLVYLNGGSTSVAFNFNRYFGLSPTPVDSTIRGCCSHFPAVALTEPAG